MTSLLRALTLCVALLAITCSAGATTMWGISDHRNDHLGAEIFSWNVNTGVFSSAPVEIEPIARARGLAVAGNVAFISYLAQDRTNDPDSASGGPSSHRMMMYNVITNTILGDVATPRLYTGLTWDGKSLYGGSPYDNAIFRLGVAGQGDGATYTGVDTLVAAIADNFQGNPGNYNSGTNWANNLPGLDPVTGKYYVNFNQIEYSRDDTLEQAGGKLTLYNRLTGSNTDQLGSMAFDSFGRLLSTKAIGGYNVLEQQLHHTPGVYTPTGSDTVAAILYSLETVNSYTFLGGDQLYGMSPAGPAAVPEPATLVLAGLALLGLVGIARRRK